MPEKTTPRKPNPPGRPFGSVTRFPGSCVFAEEHGVSPGHVYRVLTGERQSIRLTKAYAAFLKKHGLPWPVAAKVKPIPA